MKSEQQIRNKIAEIKNKSAKGNFIKQIILKTLDKLVIETLEWILKDENTNEQGTNPEQHIFTREEIKEMMKTPEGREQFLKVEKLIFDQMAKGLVK